MPETIPPPSRHDLKRDLAADLQWIAEGPGARHFGTLAELIAVARSAIKRAHCAETENGKLFALWQQEFGRATQAMADAASAREEMHVAHADAGRAILEARGLEEACVGHQVRICELLGERDRLEARVRELERTDEGIEGDV